MATSPQTRRAPSPNFESILDTPTENIERPLPAPQGTYDFIVKGLPEHGESSQKKTPFVRFTLAYQQALDDVDEEALNEWLTRKDGTVDKITEKQIKLTFYTTPDAMWRLTEFLEHCGIELEGKTVRQSIDETPNCSLRGVISRRPSEDGEQIFAEVKKTMLA